MLKALPNLLSFIIIFISGVTMAQHRLPSKSFDQSNYPLSVEELNTQFGQNKKIPAEFQLPCLIALSYYPELSNVSIDFSYKKIATSMAARPGLDVIFRGRNNRRYEIFINTDTQRVKGVLLHQVPFNAQIGIIAHELAHIVDYEKKGLFSLATTGFKYLFIKFRRKIEEETDRTTIKHGLGWQLYSFSDFLFTSKEVPVSYLNYKKKVYYSPSDVLNLLNRMEEYR